MLWEYALDLVGLEQHIFLPYMAYPLWLAKLSVLLVLTLGFQLMLFAFGNVLGSACGRRRDLEIVQGLSHVQQGGWVAFTPCFFG
jgi:hypothetical protein